MKRLSSFCLAVLVLISCKEQTPSVNKFSDPVLVKIADLKDKRLSDSLYTFFTNDNPLYREESVLAFGSIQDSAAVDRIGKLLADESKNVRRAAAFALGQTRSQQSSSQLMQAIANEKDTQTANELLEAYGKVSRPWRASGYTQKDTTTTQGLAWSIYRAGLNNAVDTADNKLAIELLTQGTTANTKLGAAHFFARGAKSFEPFLPEIAQSALDNASVDVQMASAFALRKITIDSSRRTIEKILQNKPDYRVSVNAIRALQAFPFEKTKEHLLKALTDTRVNTGIAASEVILAVVTENNWIEIANKAPEIQNWRAQANLYQAVLKVNDNKAVVDEVKKIYQQSTNVYQKAALLAALQQSFSSLDFIAEELAKADTAVLRSTAAAALVALNTNRNFKPSFSKRFLEIYIKAMATGDPAVIGTIAGALGDSTLGYRNVIKDFSFLYEARKKLSLPKDNEALQPLEAAIAYFEKRKLTNEVKNEFNHPIDWTLVKSIPSNQVAVIKTSKGNIIIRLLVEEAPGSVANFVSLAQKDYFDQKFFHRVVPNFVVQAGCNRGDGWGSEDYSIRSEFSPRKYTTGSLGMASAGKDTEGTQWFITHSPTPHLDGRYTIFAEVESGMDVVHRIEVGDRILDVEIK